MKWDSSVKQPDGTRIREAVFQTHEYCYEVTDYNGKRVVLRDHSGTVLAEAWPAHRLQVGVNGKRYRPWMVEIATPGHKYGFVTVPTKDRAIALMLSDEERKWFQGRPMGERSINPETQKPWRN